MPHRQPDRSVTKQHPVLLGAQGAGHIFAQPYNLESAVQFNGSELIEHVSHIFPNIKDKPRAPEGSQTEIDVHLKGECAILTIISRLENGLELRPQTITLRRVTDSSLRSPVVQLASDHNALYQELQKTKAELEITQKTLQQIVDDKKKYEDVVIKRVSEMLKERNAWIQKFQNVKDEGSLL